MQIPLLSMYLLYSIQRSSPKSNSHSTCVLYVMCVIKRELQSPSHRETAVQAEGADLLLILVCMYPLHTGE